MEEISLDLVGACQVGHLRNDAQAPWRDKPGRTKAEALELLLRVAKHDVPFTYRSRTVMGADDYVRGTRLLPAG